MQDITHSNHSLSHLTRKHQNSMAITHVYNLHFKLHFISHVHKSLFYRIEN